MTKPNLDIQNILLVLELKPEERERVISMLVEEIKKLRAENAALIDEFKGETK